MTEQEIKDTFEAFFEKYKKTEGDRTSWSAFWTDLSAAGSFEINLTKCPRGTVFKPFAGKVKLPEIEGWEAFFAAIPELEREHPGLFEKDRFFQGMKEMV
ncbi:MAG: hypothetical protein AB7D51_02915 [Desulfovibrionaceae bacterium]